MPPLRLTSVLQTALPHLSENGRAVLSALGCMNGHPPGSTELATWLGFHDRYQLARALRRDGLPPLEVIGGWARTLYWMTEAETSGKSLRELAERERLDPAVAYRLVRRVTGRRWSEVRREGLALTLLRFRDRCGKKAAVSSVPPAVGQNTPVPPPRIPVRLTRRNVAGQSLPVIARTPGHRVIQTISERVAVDGAPFDVAFAASGEALVTRAHAAAVDVLRFNPMRVARTIPVGPVPARVVPNGNTLDGGQLAYVTTQFAEAVSVIDLERGQRVATIAVPGHPLGAVLSPDGHTLYVTTNQDRLLAISTLQRAVVGMTAIPLGIPQLVTHPSGQWVLVSCWRAGVVVEVDAASMKITRRFEVGGIVQDVVVSPDGQMLYAANEAGWLDAIHLASGRRTATIEFGTPALGLGLSTDAMHLYVGLLGAGKVLVLQRQGLVQRASIPVGGRPRLITNTPDGNAILVANEAGWVDLVR